MEVTFIQNQTVLQSVIDAILVVSKQRATPDDQLFADLGLDSLDVVDVQMTLEEMYGKNVDWDKFWEPRRFDWLETMSYSATVRDLAEFLEGEVG